VAEGTATSNIAIFPAGEALSADTRPSDQAVVRWIKAKAAKDAATDTATVRHGSDSEPGLDQELSRTLASVIAVLLAGVDAVPSYFTAQAFGLDQTATLVITMLLVAALGAVMWLLSLFSARRQARAGWIVEVVLGIGLVMMMILRAQFLAATSGSSPATALMQAGALTAMTGGLVAVGYIVLERRKPKVVAVAERTGGQRRVTAAETTTVAKRLRANADDARRGLDNYIVPHALKTNPPEGLDHHRFVAALRAVVLDLLVGQEGSIGSG
jgi:hypothetical protein